MSEQKLRKYIIDNSVLMEQWDWDKNNEFGLYPDKITCGSGKKVWWRCKYGHSYSASIPHRLEGKGCPYCAGRKVLEGFNDLQTKFPHIAKEWNYEKNYPLLPTQVVGGTKTVVWWTCPLGHNYEMSILGRTQGNKCPICSGKRVEKGVNDLATTHPNLIDEWLWDKNNKLGISPYKITYGSIKKVWWKCTKCGYEWYVSPNNRTNQSTGCPCCANKKIVPGVNDLQTVFPDIAKKWHPTKNQLKPTEVAPFSNKYVWWVCENDERHVFKARISHLTISNLVCPVCDNRRIIVGVNDLQTTHPKLIKEWNWDKNNKLGILPSKITKGNNNKVWWKCEKCGNEWQATVASRAGMQHCGCPECKKDLSSSFPEKAIAYYLSKFFKIEENKHFGWLGRSEIDIYIQELNLGIEYDGKVWHFDATKDAVKDNICKDNEISLIRIREKQCPKYESDSYKIIRENITNSSLEDVILEVLEIINHKYSLELHCDVNIERDYNEILVKIATGKKENSVATTHLIKTWNYERNGTLSPESISMGSHVKVWWKCEKGHEWKASVYNRVGQKTGCPICAGKKVLTGYNDFETLYPAIAKEWDYNKNTKKPNQVRPMDNIKYWWICPQCGNSYLMSLSDRVGRNHGCPQCGRLRIIASHFKKVVCVETNEVFLSIKEAAIKHGLNRQCISNCCKGKQETTGGYHWKFVDN